MDSSTGSAGGRVASDDAVAQDAPVLLYDGLCGFCDSTVKFLLVRDPDGPLRFAPLQGELAAKILARHPQLEGIDSLVLVERDSAGIERVHVRSSGALALARYLGGAWRLAAVLRVVPRPLRDMAYDAFARVRYRVFGRYDACRLPTPQERRRFLD